MKPLTLILMLWPLAMTGQTWFPDDAVWHYGYSSGFGTQGYVRFDVTGDTVVNGQASRKVMRTRETYNFISQQYGSEALTPIVAHEASGVVWLHIPSTLEFDTLYNINALPGDHWLLPPMPDPFLCTAGSRMVVTDTGITTIGSVSLRWLAVDIHYIHDQGGSVLQDTIIERVGTRIYMLPHDLCNGSVDGQEGGPLRCYQDAEISYAVSELPCELIVGTPEINGPAPHLQPFPNPGHDRVWLDGMVLDATLHATVYDARGVAVLSKIIQPQAAIDMSALAPGLYTIVLRTSNGGDYRLKWMKK